MIKFFKSLRVIEANTVKRQLAVVAMVLALLAALAGASLATDASGIVSSAIVARAGFVDPVDIKLKVGDGSQEVIHATNAGDTVMQQIVIGPGGSTGWHSHPGPVVVLVKAGQLTFYSGDDPTCTGRTYSAGQAFIDSGQGHVHIAHNLSLTDNTELWVTYFDVPPGESIRIGAPAPGNCGF